MPPSSCWQRGFGGWNLWLKPQVLLPPGGSKRQAMKRPGRDAGQPAWLCRGGGVLPPRAPPRGRPRVLHAVHARLARRPRTPVGTRAAHLTVSPDLGGPRAWSV